MPGVFNLTPHQTHVDFWKQARKKAPITIGAALLLALIFFGTNGGPYFGNQTGFVIGSQAIGLTWVAALMVIALGYAVITDMVKI